MKRKLVLSSAVVLVLALLAAGTYAYFAGETVAHNVITTGTIQITLNDEIAGGQQTDTGWMLAGVMPGQAVEKTVSVSNRGSGASWIRVKLDITVTKDGEQLPLTFGDGENVLLFATQNVWLESDGYCYYFLPVPAGQTTPDLFAENTLMLNPRLPNAYQDCTVAINVLAQAVQVKNNGETIPQLTEENVGQIAPTFPQD